jgi:hypothetical protein
MTALFEARPRIAIAAMVLPAILLSGCGGSRVSGLSPQEEKVERLIRFKEAVSVQNFTKVLRTLAPADSAQIVDGSGAVPEEMQRRLRAVKLRYLVNQDDVQLREGRLAGVVAHLPVLVQGEAADTTGLYDLDDMESEEPTEKERRMEKVRVASRALFEAVAAERWPDALATLHPGSREVFLTRKGKLKEGTRRRLALVDTSAWRNLALRDGKLIGIDLLLPPPEPGLERAADDFFKAIRREDWNTMLGMLAGTDFRRIADSEGGLSAENRSKLAALDEEDWDSLFWYHEKLSGVADLMEL